MQLPQNVQELKSLAMENRINELLRLENKRVRAKNKLYQHKKLVKRWFDSKSSSKRDFQVGDLVLKWDKAREDKGEDTKFHKLWLGTYTITKKLGPSTFRLKNLEGYSKSLLVNGFLLKRYFSLSLLSILVYIFLWIAIFLFFLFEYFPLIDIKCFIK